MDMSLMLLEQVALSNSQWSVFNLQELPGSEELTGTVLKHYLSHFLIYYLIFFFRIQDKKGMYYTLEQKKEKKTIF